MEPTTTTPMERSFSVRMGLALAAVPGRRFLKPEPRALKMVGRVLSRVMRPAAATAPAPMGRMYVAQRSLGPICAMGTVPG